MQTANRRILPPSLIAPGRGSYEHRFGGTHAIPGAWCPNCQLPLILYVLLDMADPLAHLDVAQKQLPLLGCGRCSLSWYPFSYRILPDAGIEIVQVHRGERDCKEWYTELGDALPETPILLRPLSNRVQQAFDLLNADVSELPADIDQEFRDQLGLPEPYAFSGCNMVGGRGFLFQGLDDPWCPICRTRRMPFLSSLVNSPGPLQTAPVGRSEQISFFCCPECRAVSVYYSL